MCVCMCTICVSGAAGNRMGCQIPWNCSNSCKSPWGCWELSPSPLQEAASALNCWGISPAPGQFLKWSEIFQVENRKIRFLVISDMSHQSGGKESGRGRGPRGYANPTKSMLC